MSHHNQHSPNHNHNHRHLASLFTSPLNNNDDDEDGNQLAVKDYENLHDIGIEKGKEQVVDASKMAMGSGMGMKKRQWHSAWSIAAPGKSSSWVPCFSG